jgi:hypothetical protein
MRKVYIYCLIDPIDNKIKYVGKSVNPKNRYRYHVNPHNTDTNKHKKNWINKLKTLGYKPEMFIIDEIECRDNEWVIIEQYWIGQIKSWGFNLYNYSIGGDNPPVKTSWSIEQRKNLIKNRKDKRVIDVYYKNEYIGRFEGINNFIRDYLNYDRYDENTKKNFNIWSSKISAILSGSRKSHKKYSFKLVC